MSILTHAFNLFLLFLHVILLQHSVRVVCRIAMSLRVVFLTTLMPPESYHVKPHSHSFSSSFHHFCNNIDVRSAVFEIFSAATWEPCIGTSVSAVCVDSTSGLDVLEELGRVVYVSCVF
jgi:hypothetical protein